MPFSEVYNRHDFLPALLGAVPETYKHLGRLEDHSNVHNSSRNSTFYFRWFSYSYTRES